MIQGPAGDLFIDDGEPENGPGNVDDSLPVIFIHSAAGSTSHWAAQLQHLRRTRRAIAIDLRGHGRSAMPANPDFARDFAIASMAEDIGAVADTLQLDRFVLVGHSMGGFVAIAYAGAHPDRVAGLFLLDPASDGRSIPQEQADGLMAALRSDAYLPTIEQYWGSIMEPSDQAVRDQLLAGLRATQQITNVEVLQALLGFDPVAPLRRYQGSKLTVITAFNETPASLQNLVPDLPSRKIAGTGHWPQLDKPEMINDLLDDFLMTAMAQEQGKRANLS
jgi:pimeloyl-ACP methyl ester carboxylesterase